MKKVLIVSPHFPPINAPDHQRVRMSLPYLREFGWDPTILAVRPEFVEGGVLDPLLEVTVPNDIDVVRGRAIPYGLTRRLGLGSLALRALPYLWRAGNRLLAAREFDLAFFSTTMFPVMILGPIWKRRFGVPYIVDIQDPWRNDYYERTKTIPPGGWLKYAVSKLIARIFEPRVMRQASAMVVVSSNYAEQILRRYSFLRRQHFTTLPFGAPEHDYELLDRLKAKPAICPDAVRRNIVYVGAAGPYMEKALRLLFSAMRDIRRREPNRWSRIHFRFIGTTYAPYGQAKKVIEPIAQHCGVADLVSEQTDRIPYFEALATLRASDGLLILGSDSEGYNPSKIYPYILAGRPILAILHEQSPAIEILHRTNAATILTFNNYTSSPTVETAKALRTFISAVETNDVPSTNWEAIVPFTAREATRQLCEVFDDVVEGVTQPTSFRRCPSDVQHSKS